MMNRAYGGFMTKAFALFVVLATTSAFAGIHDACLIRP
jgi:hypothetical protein